MVVCKFFQQGNCRYGQNCRFDHIYGSKYSYQAATEQSVQPQAQITSVTDEQLINQVNSDIQAVLKGGQWILSCYAPFKEKAAFPGISDLSPEEARLFIYEGKANNNLDQAITFMNNLFREARQKYEHLLQTSPALIKLLRSLYQGEPVSSPFSNTIQQTSITSGSSTNAASIFRSAAQTSPFGATSPNSSSIFGQSTGNTASSVFSQNPTANFGSALNQNPSCFGSQSTDPAKSIFAQASQSVFSENNQTNNFFSPQSTDTTAKSIFAQASQNVFAQSQIPKNSNIFATASQQTFGNSTTQLGNVKQEPSSFKIEQSSNIFGQHVNSEDVGVYSKEEDLTQDELEAFQSDNFSLGFVPEIPPPHSLCA